MLLGTFRARQVARRSAGVAGVLRATSEVMVGVFGVRSGVVWLLPLRVFERIDLVNCKLGVLALRSGVIRRGAFRVGFGD